MSDLGFLSSSSRRATAPPPTTPRPVAQPGTPTPYALLVGILSIASTSIALFDLWFFAAGLK
jgi:hypothetical protein